MFRQHVLLHQSVAFLATFDFDSFSLAQVNPRGCAWGDSPRSKGAIGIAFHGDKAASSAFFSFPFLFIPLFSFSPSTTFSLSCIHTPPANLSLLLFFLFYLLFLFFLFLSGKSVPTAGVWRNVIYVPKRRGVRDERRCHMQRPLCRFFLDWATVWLV